MDYQALAAAQRNQEDAAFKSDVMKTLAMLVKSVERLEAAVAELKAASTKTSKSKE